MHFASFVRPGFTFLSVCAAGVTGLLALAIPASAQTHFELLHTFSATGPSHPFTGLVQATDGNFYGTTNIGGYGNNGTIFRFNPNNPLGTFTVLHSFNGSDGASPQGRLIQANDGNLYGTTHFGGASHSGSVFQISQGGTFTLLHSFNSSTDGDLPVAGVIQATDGALYGTTQGGGAFGAGTVFKITTSGTFTVIHAFNASADGGSPLAALVQATDGNLYGTAQSGGTSGSGTVFQITTGGAYTLVHVFNGNSDGGSPAAGLIQEPPNGTGTLTLHGTTAVGGTGAGTVFTINISMTGTLFTVLHTFNAPVEGANSSASLFLLSGLLYGTTSAGGPSGGGTVFSLSPGGGSPTVLHAFGAGADGANPASEVIEGSDGNLWGTTVNSPGGTGTVYKVQLVPSVQSSVVFTFSGGNDGAFPLGPLVQLPDGNFYGVATAGGASDLGSVFRITPSGALTLLHAFAGPDGNANGGSQAGLARAKDGNLYGTTQNGGASGAGTIFQVSSGGAFSVIHSFNFNPDGGSPASGVIQAADGNLYGTTPFGGSSGNGTIYQVPLAGSPLTVLHAFVSNDGTDGALTVAGLVQANDGNFYGTSQVGGTLGRGTVFRIAPGGAYTVLHEFVNDGQDGASPIGGLIQASDGNLYGTTASGGVFGAGTVFRMTLAGTLTVIHDFVFTGGGFPEGSAPTGLIQASDGNLYGTTLFGGGHGGGAVFKITLGGILTRLYGFSGGPDGAYPQGGVIQGTDGNLYGTTSSGGLWGNGTVFRLVQGAVVTTAGDVDGDGKADLIVYRRSAGVGQFIVESSSTNYSLGTPAPLGSGASASDIPVVGDFDGDGRMDAAVFRRSTGQWLIALSSNNWNGVTTYTWGRSTDIPVPGDYDGDGRTDLAVFRPSTGQWLILLSSTNYETAVTYSWGTRGDVPVPGDYDGDGKTDLAIFRPSTGQWFIAFSSSNYTTSAAYTWGTRGDRPVPGDYDGDHKTDLGIYRPSTGEWFILTSGSGYTAAITKNWGAATDLPVPADYDGDGKIDIAVFRPSTGQWFILLSSTGYTVPAVYVLGTSTDIPVYAVLALRLANVTDTTRASDFDGDHKSDVAVYRPSTGGWYIIRSSTSTAVGYTFGASGDIPVPGDYDGDGLTDLAVFRPSSGLWFIALSSTGYATVSQYSWGTSGDIPVPGDYDGDGKTDLAVFRPGSPGQWLILLSSSNYTTGPVYVLGLSGDTPVPADYDGDGLTDPAVYRNGQWLMLLSSENYASGPTRTWGTSTDVPVPGDYDGDGITDIAVYRPSTGQWFILQSSTDNTTYATYQWGGVAGDEPVPADYDGDGKTDIAVFRPSTGQWFIVRSSLGVVSYMWGAPTDIPLVIRRVILVA